MVMMTFTVPLVAGKKMTWFEEGENEEDNVGLCLWRVGPTYK